MPPPPGRSISYGAALLFVEAPLLAFITKRVDHLIGVGLMCVALAMSLLTQRRFEA